MAGNVGRPRLHSTDTKVTQFRMDSILYTKAKKLAYINGRSFNAQLAFWAQQAVENYEKSHGKIEVEE